MCLKYPGVRCQQSYKSAKITSVEKTGEAFRELSNLKRSTPEELNLTQKQYDSKIKKGTQKLSTQRVKLQIIKDKMDATKDGIAELENLLKDDELTNDDKRELGERLDKATNSYYSRLLAYDRYNNTVQGKKPSTKIGSMEKTDAAKELNLAREAVKEERQKLRSFPVESQDFEESRDRFVKANGKLDKSIQQNKHIQNTSEYVDMGYIKDPRTSDDWDREAKRWLNDAKQLQEDGKPRAAKKFEAEGIRCLKSKSLADSNYSMTVPSIVKNNGETAKLFLYHESSNNSWSWTDGTGKHYPAQDSGNGSITIPPNVPGLEDAKVESKPTPVEYKLFTRPNGDAYSVLVPNQARCTENPDLIGHGEKQEPSNAKVVA